MINSTSEAEVSERVHMTQTLQTYDGRDGMHWFYKHVRAFEAFQYSTMDTFRHVNSSIDCTLRVCVGGRVHTCILHSPHSHEKWISRKKKSKTVANVGRWRHFCHKDHHRTLQSSRSKTYDVSFWWNNGEEYHHKCVWLWVTVWATCKQEKRGRLGYVSIQTFARY